MKTAILLTSILLGSLTYLSPAHAFRSTSLESFTDPDFKGYVPKRVLLVVTNAGIESRREIEARMVETLAERRVVALPYRQLFSPTRTWSPEALAEVLEKEEVDSALIVTLGAASSAVIPIATSFYAYGSQGSVSGTSFNTYGARSTAECSAVLVTVEGDRTVWYADVLSKASGTAFVGQKRDAKAFAKAIATRLTEDGHLPKVP